MDVIEAVKDAASSPPLSGFSVFCCLVFLSLVALWVHYPVKSLKHLVLQFVVVTIEPKKSPLAKGETT